MAASDEVVDELQDVAQGAGVVIAGTLAGMVLLLAGRALFTRTFSPGEYGTFSLSFTLILVLSVLASLGLWNGLTRQISFYHAEDEERDVGALIAWGLFVGTLGGLAVAGGVVVAAPFLARTLYGGVDAVPAVYLVAVGVPLYTLVTMLTAVYRGYSETRERVVFRELLAKGLFPAFLLPVALFAQRPEWGVAAYVAGLGVTAAAFAAYFLRSNPDGVRGAVPTLPRTWPVGRDLLRFSIPLLFAALLIQIMTWLDVLMLGYLTDTATVGRYDAVRPLVRVVPVIWGAMIFMYTPLVSRFHAEDDDAALEQAYYVLTKWFASLTFPFIVLFVCVPGAVLGAVFGPAYTAAAPALQILAVAFFLGNVMGPNGATLTAVGKTRFLMWANFAAAALNVVLNVALIPPFGITGAALATGVALVVRNVLRVWWLWAYNGVHSVRRSLLVPVALSAVGFALATPFVRPFLRSNGWALPVAVVAVAMGYALTVRATGNVAPEDRAVLSAIRDGIA